VINPDSDSCTQYFFRAGQKKLSAANNKMCEFYDLELQTFDVFWRSIREIAERLKL